jgi:hexosaminidase
MKRIILAFAIIQTGLSALSQQQNTASQAPLIALIPAPVSLQVDQGRFIFPKTLLVEAPDRQDLAQTLQDLKSHLSSPTGYPVSITNKPGSEASIRLVLNKPAEAMLGEEGYRLIITPKNIVIRANQAAGLFYGVQSLLQLLPKEIESQVQVEQIIWQAPCLTIADYPRFSWRGLMFDVSRHFFTIPEVEQFIDEMVKYKYNLLHLHLTDDEGWRIEIKSLPKLTSVGAWNVRRVGTFGTFASPAPEEPRNYGGFYTQDEIRELVKYAKQRFVDILPEIDIPGHSLAAIASYPELSCTAGSDTYRVRSGEKFMNWPGPIAMVDNTLCPANEKVYPFLDKIFTEVAQLFPFGYIHVGGDECAKNFWEKSDAIHQLMQKEGLKTMEEVQSYFEKRVEKIVESKGKKVIGWDEILEGGLAPNALVMSWRGVKGGIEAAKLGHEVVMSPTTFVYLDYMQGDALVEPPVYASLRLKTTYSFEPVPDSVDSKLIRGGQGNLWTEQVYNMRHMEYMIWPRSLAIAETLWSPKEKKDWNSFTKRTEANFGRMDVEHVKYARSMFDPVITAKKDSSGNTTDSLQVEISTEVEGLDVYYSFDNSNPDNFYPKYSTPLFIPKDASMLKVITYRDGKPIGRQFDMPVNELRRRAGLLPKPFGKAD